MTYDPLAPDTRAVDRPLAFTAQRVTDWNGDDDIVTIELAKQHLRETTDGQDLVIAGAIKAARHRIDGLTRLSLLESTWKMVLPRFPDGARPIILPHPPLVSITSVAYIDGDGQAQTLTESDDGYSLDAVSHPAQLYPGKDAGGWPDTLRGVAQPVVVTYQSGWTQQSDVPASLVQACLVTLGHLYEQREPVTDTTLERSVKWLVAAHKLRGIH